MSRAKAVRIQWILLSVLCILAIILLAALALLITNKKSSPIVANYADCMKARNAKILQTVPVVCLVNGDSFTNPSQNSEKAMSVLPDVVKPKTDEEQIRSTYAAKNPCTIKDGITVTVNSITVNGWAEISAGCEPGSGHLEVWHKVDSVWIYIIGFQEGPFCTTVIDKKISRELYATCITTEPGPTSVTDANGNPTIPNQIP